MIENNRLSFSGPEKSQYSTLRWPPITELHSQSQPDSTYISSSASQAETHSRKLFASQALVTPSQTTQTTIDEYVELSAQTAPIIARPKSESTTIATEDHGHILFTHPSETSTFSSSASSNSFLRRSPETTLPFPPKGSSYDQDPSRNLLRPATAPSETNRIPETNHSFSGVHTSFLKFTDIFRGTGGAGRQTHESIRTLWKSGRNSSSISSEELSKDDVIIAVMGPTGAGKSSFIEMATGASSGIGHNLKSCTTDIGIIKVHFREKSDFDVVFVDTPGFDDTNKSDGEILDMIARWLKKTYERNIKLSGILYLHRISDNRMAGTPLKNLRIFKQLCGANALQNIILTTTMWDEVFAEEGIQREKELRSKYWKTMIEHGSTVSRYLNTMESAWEIVEPLLLDANKRSAIELQREMVELKRQLPETKAGKELYSSLDTLLRTQRETLRRIRAETGRSGNEHVLGQLKAEYDELRKKLEVTIGDMQSLKLPLRKRFIRMLLSPLGLTMK